MGIEEWAKPRQVEMTGRGLRRSSSGKSTEAGRGPTLRSVAQLVDGKGRMYWEALGGKPDSYK